MTTYDELEAFASAGLFHNDPTEAHSASSQLDCALATAVNNVKTTTTGTIVRRKTETNVFIASTLFDQTGFFMAASHRKRPDPNDMTVKLEI